MKGPVGRVKQDVRRIWECPECGTRIKVPGKVVQKTCSCKKEGVWMKMVDEPNQGRVMSSIQKMIDQPVYDPTQVFIDESELNDSDSELPANKAPDKSKPEKNEAKKKDFRKKDHKKNS